MNVRGRPYDHLFKPLLVGDAQTGKTALLQRCIEDSFTERYEPTIGVDFKIHSLNVDDQCCKLQMWEGAGAERFQDIVQKYYKGANAILLCFDLTDHNSFANIKKWQEDVKTEIAEPGKDPNQVAWFLVGTKLDCTEQRAVDREEAEALANEIGATYFETSAKKGENVEALFTEVATQCLAKVSKIENEIEEPLHLSTQPGLDVVKTKTNHYNACSFFAVASVGAVGGACVGAGVGLLLSGATFGTSVIAGIVIGAFLGAVIAAATYLVSNNSASLLTCCSAKP